MYLEKAAPVLAFRAIPTILLALISYLSIFIALIVTDALPNVPQNQDGLNIQQAYEDLRQVNVQWVLWIPHWILILKIVADYGSSSPLYFSFERCSSVVPSIPTHTARGPVFTCAHLR
jgi:hypothetical protein